MNGMADLAKCLAGIRGSFPAFPQIFRDTAACGEIY